MQLEVRRRQPDQDCTPGELFIDGQFECFTLEPSPGNLQFPAIPAGTYPMRLLPSLRFQQLTPHVLNVPNRSFIEVHPGNKPKNTDGCTLVGESASRNWVGSSRAAFQKLMVLLQTDSDNLSITYTDSVALSVHGEITL